jgi:hypothetical protein
LPFANAAFKLQEKGAYTKPVETKYGWHIIKLLENHPLKTFEELESELKEKIKKSPRSRIITEAFTGQLKKQYQVPETLVLPEEVYDMVSDSLIMTGKYVFDKNQAANSNELFHIKENGYTISNFLSTTLGKEKINVEHISFTEAEKSAHSRIKKMMNVRGSKPACDYHKELGKITTPKSKKGRPEGRPLWTIMQGAALPEAGLA